MHKYTRVAKGQGGVETKSMIDLVLVKRDMLRYVQNMRAMRGMGRGLSDHHVVLCKFMLVEAWIKRREVVAGTRRVRRNKLRKHQYRERYGRSLEGKRVEWDGDNNLEHMWEQVKWAMGESEREVYGSVRVGEKNSKSLWWNDDIKTAVRGKEAAWKVS